MCCAHGGQKGGGIVGCVRYGGVAVNRGDSKEVYRWMVGGEEDCECILVMISHATISYVDANERIPELDNAQCLGRGKRGSSSIIT